MKNLRSTNFKKFLIKLYNYDSYMPSNHKLLHRKTKITRAELTWSSPEPLSLRTASTASFEKCSLCCERILELSVVRAMLSRSSRNVSILPLWSKATLSKACLATSTALRQPAIIVCGWIFCSMSFSASFNSSDAEITIEYNWLRGILLNMNCH